MDIVISEHAYDRVKERCGLKKKAIDRMATKVLKTGYNSSKLKGQAAGWIREYKDNHTAQIMYIYGNKAWVYAENEKQGAIILVTVLNIPTRVMTKINAQLATA